jgi:Tfp pilus assembly protein PilW
MPFHYGYWDTDSDMPGHRRAANELTITDWDPVSKQPIFKTSAVRIAKLAAGNPAMTAAPSTTASKPSVANGSAATNGEPDARAEELLVTTEQAR